MADQYNSFYNDYQKMGGTGGAQYDWLSNYLKNTATEGIPYKQDMLNTSIRGIQTGLNNQRAQLQTSLSQRGLGRGGISVGAQQGINNAGNTAIANATSQINQQDIQARTNAIQQLLGLNQSQASNNLGLYGQRNQSQLGQDQLELQKAQFEAQQGQGLTGGLQGLIGAGAGLAMNYFTGGAGSLLTSGLASAASGSK